VCGFDRYHRVSVLLKTGARYETPFSACSRCSVMFTNAALLRIFVKQALDLNLLLRRSEDATGVRRLSYWFKQPMTLPPSPTATRATSTRFRHSSAGTQVVEGARGHKGTRRDSSRKRGFRQVKFASAARGVLFWNSLICLKASENLVGVLAMNHPN
jgi:hypothetical protein